MFVSSFVLPSPTEPKWLEEEEEEEESESESDTIGGRPKRTLEISELSGGGTAARASTRHSHTGRRQQQMGKLGRKAGRQAGLLPNAHHP